MAALITGCGSDAKYYEGVESSVVDVNEEYKLITVTTEYYSYSFEYSTYYIQKKPKNIRPEWEIPDGVTSLLAPNAEVDLVIPSDSKSVRSVKTSYTPAYISIHTYDPTFNGSESPRTSSETLTWRLEGEAKWENYKLIERYPLEVSGIVGDFAHWEVDWFNLFAEQSDEPPLEYRWQVLFDYKNFIWVIEASSLGPDYRDRIEADFHHTIETFKILD